MHLHVYVIHTVTKIPTALRHANKPVLDRLVDISRTCGMVKSVSRWRNIWFKTKITHDETHAYLKLRLQHIRILYSVLPGSICIGIFFLKNTVFSKIYFWGKYQTRRLIYGRIVLVKFHTKIAFKEGNARQMEFKGNYYFFFLFIANKKVPPRHGQSNFKYFNIQTSIVFFSSLTIMDVLLNR